MDVCGHSHGSLSYANLTRHEIAILYAQVYLKRSWPLTLGKQYAALLSFRYALRCAGTILLSAARGSSRSERRGLGSLGSPLRSRASVLRSLLACASNLSR